MLFTVTAKQVNVIYGAWKSGKIQADKSVLDAMYTMVRNQGRDGSTNILMRLDKAIRGAIDAIFGGDFEKAQECIEAFIKADEDSKREWEQIRADAARYASMRTARA